MTPEKKIQEYDNALDAARRIYVAMKEKGDVDGMRNLKTIFPTINENEDEIIKREIIKYIKTGTYHKDWLAWLEKQGEPVEINPTEFDTRLQVLIGKFDSLSKEELMGSLSFWLNVVQNDGTYKDEEKQGDQKPYGQRKECWDCQVNYAGVCKGSCAMKRKEQNPLNYENANIQQTDFAPQEVMPRYNIGDVLCDKSCTTLNKESRSNFEITDIRDGMYICDKCSFPISQQDEYELVAKKIEQTPAWSEVDKDFMYDILSNLTELKDRYGEKYGNVGKCIDWLKSLKGRYTWKPSDEDEKIRKTLIRFFEDNYPNEIELYDETVTVNKVLAWLQKKTFEQGKTVFGTINEEDADIKELKKNPTWSEVDENMAERLLGWLDTLGNYIHHDAIDSLDLRRERMRQVEQIKTWFKSIRLQNTWKPSEEQMNALDSTLQYSQVSHNSFEYLNSLYNELKKLKQ